MGAATFAYFLNDSLNFHWIDPPSEPKRPVALPEPGDAWRYYYQPAQALWGAQSGSKSKAETTIAVPLPEFDITLKVHPMLAAFFSTGAWEEAQRVMFEIADELEADGFQPDGLRIECGPTWMDKFDGSRITEG